jgi:hypothetical protein
MKDRHLAGFARFEDLLTRIHESLCSSHWRAVSHVTHWPEDEVVLLLSTLSFRSICALTPTHTDRSGIGVRKESSLSSISVTPYRKANICIVCKKKFRNNTVGMEVVFAFSDGSARHFSTSPLQHLTLRWKPRAQPHSEYTLRALLPVHAIDICLDVPCGLLCRPCFQSCQRR